METLTPIRLLYSGELIDLTTVYDDQDVIHTEVQTVTSKVINTTVGRVILNDATWITTDSVLPPASATTANSRASRPSSSRATIPPS